MIPRNNRSLCTVLKYSLRFDQDKAPSRCTVLIVLFRKEFDGHPTKSLSKNKQIGMAIMHTLKNIPTILKSMARQNGPRHNLQQLIPKTTLVRWV